MLYDKVISTGGGLPPNEDPETSIENSHIFANGTHFAKVEGSLEGAISSSAEIHYYHIRRDRRPPNRRE